MDFVIVFFRDVLDGPLYIAVCVVCSILICSCIGYMGEKYLMEKKQGEEFASKHASADDKPLTAADAQRALQNATATNAATDEAAAQVQAEVAATQEVDAVAEQSPEGQLEEEEEQEENASVVYAIGGGQVEELLEDD